ncbi:hypothetical protein BC833DRAFT_586986 [Globomyces pollinis-pini]|nr:hypothetical protein BC833DRAFT_586986 [Globomyces pollinis-pini]
MAQSHTHNSHNDHDNLLNEFLDPSQLPLNQLNHELQFNNQNNFNNNPEFLVTNHDSDFNNINHFIPDDDNKSDISNHTLSNQDLFISTSPNRFNGFLDVPSGFGNRSRSGSLASSVGFENFSVTDGSDYGEIAPFPGSLVVQVPSPWIHGIPSPNVSPSISPAVSPMIPLGPDFFQLPPHQSLSTYLENSDGVGHVDFNEFMHAALSETPLPMEPWNFNNSANGSLDPSESINFSHSVNNQVNSGIYGSPGNQSNSGAYGSPNFNQSSVSINISESKQDTSESSKSAALSTSPPTTVPDGRFWKVIKNNGQTLYQCPYPECTKTFTRPYNLKSHYRSHTGERPYVCDAPNCDSSFARKHDLKRHSKLHSGERLFRCQSCNKTFSRNDALGRHLKPTEQGKESACALRIRLNELEAEKLEYEKFKTES